MPVRVALLSIWWGTLLAGCGATPLKNEEDQARYDPGEAWQESSLSLPDYPRESDLMRLPEGGGSVREYLLDSRSLSHAEDGVTRYTIVVRSPGGAWNVQYEGLRCETKELKTYAFGRANGTFRQFHDPAWVHGPWRGAYAYRRALLETYMCDTEGWPLTRKQILRGLRDQGWSLKPYEAHN